MKNLNEILNNTEKNFLGAIDDHSIIRDRVFKPVVLLIAFELGHAIQRDTYNKAHNENTNR